MEIYTTDRNLLLTFYIITRQAAQLRIRGSSQNELIEHLRGKWNHIPLLHDENYPLALRPCIVEGAEI